MPLGDDRRHGSRYHGDEAMLARGGDRRDRVNNSDMAGVDWLQSVRVRLLDPSVCLCTDDTQCKQVDRCLV